MSNFSNRDARRIARVTRDKERALPEIHRPKMRRPRRGGPGGGLTVAKITVDVPAATHHQADPEAELEADRQWHLRIGRGKAVALEEREVEVPGAEGQEPTTRYDLIETEDEIDVRSAFRTKICAGSIVYLIDDWVDSADCADSDAPLTSLP